MNHGWIWAGVACGLAGFLGCETSSDSISGSGGAGADAGAGGGSDELAGAGGSATVAGGAGGVGSVDGGGAAASGEGGTGPAAAGAAGESGAGGDAGAGGHSESAGTDVVGTVVDAEGAAVAAAKVEIAGQLVTTDAAGTFTVHDVPETYSAFIVFVPPPFGAGPPVRTVEVYDELTTRSPHFKLQDAPIPSHNGGVSGSLSGGAGFPVPQGHKLGLTASNSDQRLANGGGAYLPPAGYSIPILLWASEPAHQFTFGALQWAAGNDGLPTGYDGWATDNVAAPDNQTVTRNLVLAPVESRTVTGTITKPTDCILTVVGAVGGITLFEDTSGTGSFSYLLPKPLAGATTTLTANCRWSAVPGLSSSASVGLATANSLNLAVPSPPRLTLPDHQATGASYSTPFTWVAGDNQLRALIFEAQGWTVYRFGKGTSSTLPDLTRFGLTIPPSAAISWRVVSVTSDAGATAWEDDTTALSHLASTGHSISRATSESRTLTFAP